MTFEAGSIKGTMSLDTAPTMEAMRNIARDSQTMKEKMEREFHEINETLKESIKGTMTVDTAPAIVEMKKAVAEANSLKELLGKGIKEPSGSSGYQGGDPFHGIRQMVGRKSVFGQATQLLMGTGIAMAMNEVSSMLKDSTANVVKLRDEFDAGAISADEMYTKLEEGVPILGDLVSAGDSLFEMFTGAKEAVQEVNREAESTNQIFKDQAAAMNEVRDTIREAADEMAQINLHNMNRDVDPFTAQRNDILAAQEKRHRDEGGANAEKIANETKDAKKYLDDANAKLVEAKQALENNKEHGAIATDKNGNVVLDKDLRPVTLDQQFKDAVKQASNTQAAAEKNYQDQMARVKASADVSKAQDVSTAADVAGIDRRAKEKIEHMRNAAQEINDEARREADRSEMQSSGEGYKADVQAIRDHADELKKARADAIKQQIEDQKPGVMDTLRMVVSGAAYDMSVDRDEANQILNAAKEEARRINDLKSETHEMELKNAGDFAAAELEQINRGYDDKIAAARSGEERLALEKQKAAATSGAALDAINREALEKMGYKESPLEKFKEEMDQLIKEINSGALKDPEIARSIAAGFQKDYQDSTPRDEYQATQQDFRRFNFDNVAPPLPQVGDTNENLLQVSTDSLTEHKKQTALQDSINSGITKINSWTDSWTAVPPP